jgi:chorismate synthase
MFRYLTAGESHGPALVAVAEGLPAGLNVVREDLAAELARRRLGFGRGGRMKLEQDELEFLGGVRHGISIGSPIAIMVRNTEFDEKWSEEMNPYSGEPIKRLTTPRPGHADLVGMMKYDLKDARNILERASARETAARTVVGYLSKVFLAALGVDVLSHVVEIGSVSATRDAVPTPADLERIDASAVRVLEPETEERMIAEIEAARADRDTLGGVVEVVAHGLVPGIGSHVHGDRRLDARLAEALMSIQAMKGVEVGDGFETARRRGSEAHDEIFRSEDGYARETNRAGGTEGGMSIGGVLRVRVAMKPISTVPKSLRTVDVASGESDRAFYERSDVVAVPAAGVVAEQMVAIVLAQEIQRKFGGDTIGDVVDAWDRYRSRLERF